ncbi:toprim domain-containing protein [Geminicoccus flavidas]|uniref:toprim domain-containing protein n=1 Tax=Geminicoccus flavidas TaxID=2506407 RepID=UPI001358D68F|nr:toprim domain-containing protein [Geminicoccus flavidas]
MPVLHPDHAQWLEARGLSTGLTTALGINSAECPDGGDWNAFYVRHGRVVNHKYRRVDGKGFMQDKGGAQTWWNHDCLLDDTLSSEPAIITEGELDAIAAMQAGFRRVVSVRAAHRPRRFRATPAASTPSSPRR